jgi:hypothetical protein
MGLPRRPLTIGRASESCRLTRRVAASGFPPARRSALGWGPQGLGVGYPVGAAILTTLLVTVFLAGQATGLPFDNRTG